VTLLFVLHSQGTLVTAVHTLVLFHCLVGLLGLYLLCDLQCLKAELRILL